MNNLKLLKIKTRIPEFTLFPSKNGSKFYYMPLHTLPLVDGNILIKHPPVLDPPHLPGITSLTMSMIKKGTHSRTVEQLDFEIESLGIQIQSQVQADRILINFDAVADYLQNSIELLNDMLLHSTFPEEEFNKLKEKRIHSLRRRLDNSSKLASHALMYELFNGNDYGFPISGTINSLQKISLDDIKNHFYSRIVTLPRVFFLVGDISEKRFKKVMSELDYSPEQVSESVHKTPVHQNQKKVIIIDKPDATQIQIRIGFHTISHQHPDYYPLSMGTIVLGGSFSSRLMQEIRVRKGYSYGAYAQLNPINKDHSIFTVSTFTRPENVQEVLSIIFTEIQKIKQDLIPEEELIMGKNYVSGQYPLSFEQYHDLANKLLKIELFGYTKEEIESFPEILAKVTANQVQDAFQHVFPNDDFTVILVGPAREILNNLSEKDREIAKVKTGWDLINPPLS